MEARLFLVFVILCQMIITESLGGVTTPFSDLVGKVTPIKPKPISPSTISSLSSSKSDTKDIMHKLLSSTSGGSGFTSPLALTSSSKALPVPKIDSLSITDVILPERLRDKLLSRKRCDTPIRTVKPDIRSPEVLPPYKYPFLSLPSKLSTTLPSSSSDMLSTSLNKLSSLPSIKSLPFVSVKPLTNTNVLASPTRKLPLTLEATKPLLSQQFTTSILYPSSSSGSLPYPLYYKPMYLPGVKTPFDKLPLSYKPILKSEKRKFNFPNQSYAQDSANTLSDSVITSSEISKPQNMLQLPKVSSNVPFPIKPVFSLEPNSGCTPVPLKRRFEPRESLLPPFDLRNDIEPKSLLSSLPYKLVDKISDFTRKPLDPPKISSTVIGASMPVNDCSIKQNVPNMYPAEDSYVKGVDRVSSNDFSPRITFDSIPSFRQINVPEIFNSPLIPAGITNKNIVMSNKPISNELKYSPPTIPCAPIPIIFSGSLGSSPITYCPSRTSQTPITSSTSYINQSQSSSITQSTSKIVSSINDLVSKITQNILSSYQSQLSSVPQNVLQNPRFILKSNPYADAVLKPEETSSVILTIPKVDPMSSQSILPIISLPIDLNPPAVDISSISSLEAPCISSACEVPSSQPLPISSPQTITATMLPVTSLITFSPPQLCPSYLPSPTLPSYPSIASPLYMEAPVYKVSSSKKNSDVEKLLELMLIADILNNEESFDWDDLDTLLAILSIS